MSDTTPPDERDRSPSTTTALSRRRLLAVGGAMAATTATAGCLGGDSDDSNGDENGDGDGNGSENGDENGNENGTEASAEASITSLDVAGQGEQASIDAEQSTVATEVAVENAGEAAGTIDVTVAIGEAEAATSSTATLDPGASETVTLDDVAVPAAKPTETTHTVTATASSGDSADDTAEGDLTVGALDAEPVITALTLDGEPPAGGSRSLRTGSDLPVGVTVTNEGTVTASFDVSVHVGERVESATTGDIAGGESATVTLSGLTGDLATGSHDLTAETAVDSRTVELSVLDEAAIDATVYTQSVGEANLAESGTLVVTDESDTEVASHDLSSGASVVLTEGIDDGETYTLAVEEPNGGAFPPASETVTVDGVSDVSLVAGYEFQGAESYDFTAYIWWAERTREWGYKGSHAATGNHYTLYVASNRIVPSFSIEDSLFDRDIGMWELKDDVLGGTNPFTEIVVDGQGYYRMEGGGSDGSWTELDAEKVLEYPPHTSTYQTVLKPLDELTENDPERQSYVGEGEVNGVAVDVYDVDLGPVTEGYGDATVYVNPETGYVMRFETADEFPFSDDPDTYYIIEFMNHDEVETFDFEGIGFNRDNPDISSS